MTRGDWMCRIGVHRWREYAWRALFHSATYVALERCAGCGREREIERW